MSKQRASPCDRRPGCLGSVIQTTMSLRTSYASPAIASARNLRVPFGYSRSLVSSLARHARAVEMLLDLRAVAGALETRAEELGLPERDGGAIQPAHEFSGGASLARGGTAFSEKHAVAADAGVESLMRRIEVIEDLAERV